MVEKKRSPKKKGREEKGGKGEPKGTGNGKHSEQERAEQEDKRTFQERNSGGEAQAENPSRKRTGKGRFPIVGIGASAGGLQALEAFFDALPADSGLAFVVITHTDPEHESLLPELLKKKAKIPVKLIQEALAAKPDTVYLPPSNRDLILKQRKFHLEKRPAKYGIHMPVDLFFKHLAEDVGDLAAGVILSGTGTDGTQGLRLIKEKAGVAVAQDPNSARHGGMPGSAIETGLVDYVLPPWEIPQCLIQYFKHPAAIQYKHADKEQKTPDPLRRILTLLANRTRHDFSLYKENTLIRRIERRMTVTRSRNALDYLKTLHEDPKEVRALFQDLLIGVTNFFRDPETFAYLKQEVLPGLISGKEDGALRVWVPGCATGEEAYSVAIILQECLEEKESYRQFQVFGTDIDSHAIEKARHASYIQNIVSDVSPERLNRFFTREDSMYRVKSDIREKVVFAEQNLLADPPFSKLDLLVCRNLLIYLKLEAQNRLIPLFHYALRDGGILFLGTSEGVGPHHDFFEQVSKHYNIFRKKNHLIRPQLQFPTASRKLEGSTQKQEADKEPEKLGPSLGRTVDKVLMEEHTPACVVVNQRGEILHFHGHTGKYLEPAPGAPTLQIADMAREGLRFVLLSALRRVNEENPEIREKGVKVKTNHEFQRIDLVVKRLNEPPLKNCRMVIFEELPQPAEIEQRPESRRPAQQDTRRVPELERELMRLRQDYRGAMEELQTSNEELKSSNEELHSSNEELQSTNEELDSSREELNSLNEELNTVNSELTGKIADLRDAYSAINSVLNHTQVAVVFLDNQFRVKRFTPEAKELLNVMDSDVGRPLDHLAHNLEYENLGERVRQVVRDLSSVDEEIRTKDGSWYRMRIMVYRPEKHIIDGVVLTFINIDAQKKAQQELQETSTRAVSAAKQFAENIVATVRESLLVLDGQLRVVTANRSFYETFLTSADETEGRSLFELGNSQWDIPRLRKLLGEIVKKNKTFQDYMVEHRFPKVGFKRMLLNARMLQEEHKEENRILLAIEDVTEKQAPSREGKSEP